MRYRTIVADPPWEYPRGFKTSPDRPGPSERAAGADVSKGAIVRRELPYASMTLSEIAGLPVRDLFDSHGANLFLWTTNRYLHDAFHVCDAWGAKYRQMAVWSKPPGSRPPLRAAVAPNCAEFILVCRFRGGAMWGPAWESNVVTVRRPAGHSQKPETFMDMVEQVSPGPYLELFARRQRLGWDTWGNEALCHVDWTKGSKG